jgi:type VI protein secretion system component VasK
VIGRLEEYPARGNALIAAAWIGIFGGFIVPRVGSWLIAIGADSPEMAIRNQLILAAIATGLTVVGAIFLVWLIWWVEVRIARRRHVQMSQAAPTQPFRPLQPPLPDATPVQTIIAAAGDGTTGDSPVPTAAP